MHVWIKYKFNYIALEQDRPRLENCGSGSEPTPFCLVRDPFVLHPQVDDPEFWSTHLQGRSLMCSGVPFSLCGDVSDCKQFAEVTLYGDLSTWCTWPRHRRKPVQRSHDLSNVASNAKEAVPVCQQQENTQPALIRRKSTSGLLWINIVINYS